MNNTEIIENEMLGETVHKITLSNGLQVYICIRKGFKKKIGMFGTKYGSFDNDFVDIFSGKRVNVPDGIAHFLEHKLFEKEDDNALDIFSKEGITANAYTSFDQTVYFFETIDKLYKGLEILVRLVKTPYFTVENVEKEQGIIGQEISMFDNDPNFNTYFNVLRGMYVEHPIKIDIAGTVESIAKIDKDILYTCYNTFYNPDNMFMIIVGDVNIEETIKVIEENLKIHEKHVKSEKVVKFSVHEPENIKQKKIEKDMGIYMPQISIGFKLKPVEGNDIIKNQIISEIISEIYFSKSSKFYESEYNKSAISDDIDFIYEGDKSFSHVIISTMSTKIETIKKDIFEYISKIKNEDVDMKLFEITKRKKIGENIIESENISNSYKRIIDSILNDSKLYYDIELLRNINTSDIKNFLNNLDEIKSVVSVVK